MFAGFRPTARFLVLGSLASTMILSLAYSGSLRYGHADVPVARTATEIQPLEVGDMAPHFTVATVENRRFEFEPRRLDRPVILVAFRGGWCPYCNMHLSELRDVLPQIRDLDIDVLFLSGDRPGLLVEGLSGQTQDDIAGLGYTIVSDANAHAAIALGIAFKASDNTVKRLRERGDDIEESSMARHGVLPVPAVFAVNRAGKITFAHVNPDYRLRLSADDLLAAARRLAAAE